MAGKVEMGILPATSHADAMKQIMRALAKRITKAKPKAEAPVQAKDIPVKAENVVGVKSTSNAAVVPRFLVEDELRRSNGLPDEEPLYD